MEGLMDMLLSSSQTQGFSVAEYTTISYLDYAASTFKIGYRSSQITRKNKEERIISLPFYHFVKYYYKSTAIGPSQRFVIIRPIAHSKILLKANLNQYLEQD
jgi:hypothetical protein